jgi:hypothetical protein
MLLNTKKLELVLCQHQVYEIVLMIQFQLNYLMNLIMSHKVNLDKIVSDNCKNIHCDLLDSQVIY